jgi:hypothetical protein
MFEIYEAIRNHAIGNTCDSRKDAKARRFGEISKCLILRAWRPFDFAQDTLGSINFLKVVLSNISKVSAYYIRSHSRDLKKPLWRTLESLGKKFRRPATSSLQLRTITA